MSKKKKRKKKERERKEKGIAPFVSIDELI